jgi:hypothetical protein
MAGHQSNPILSSPRNHPEFSDQGDVGETMKAEAGSSASGSRDSQEQCEAALRSWIGLG